MATKYSILKGLLTKEEASELRNYVGPLLQQHESNSGVIVHTLSNRPDAWDSTGYIERGLAVSSGHFQSAIYPKPLDRVGFYVRQVGTGGQVPPIVELDTSRDAEVHEINRKIGVLVLNEDYAGGRNLFVNHGETIKPEAGDLILYEVDEINRVGIEEVENGSRLEIIYMYMEINSKTRFDEFYMPPMENDSDRF